MQGILPQAGSALAFQLLASVLYAVLAVHLWRRHWAAGTAPAAGQGSHLLQLAALAVHAIAVFGPMFAGHTLRIGVGDAISAILWLTVLIYGLGSLFYRLEALQALIMPVAAVSAMLPALLPAEKVIPNTELLAFRLHLVLSMLAYSLFTMAMLHAVLMAFVEGRLHRVHRGDAGFFARLPPLLTLERLLFHTIAAAFAMLTLTLATGAAFSEAIFGRALRFDHKTLFAILSWTTFAVLLAGRHLRGWRGRTALRMTMAGFLLLLLAYIGSRFVAEVLLGRG